MDLLPLSYDQTSKKVSLAEEVASKDFKELCIQIEQLNTISNELVSAGSDVPPAPSPQSFNKKLALMTKKLHETAVSLMKTQKYPEAVKAFSTGLEMALRRSKFEPFQMSLQEILIFLMGRCDAYIMDGKFAESYQDADLLCNLIPNVGENHWRRGVSSMNLGRLEKAKSDFERGLAFEETNPKLLQHLEIVKAKIAEANGEDI